MKLPRTNLLKMSTSAENVKSEPCRCWPLFIKSPCGQQCGFALRLNEVMIGKATDVAQSPFAANTVTCGGDCSGTGTFLLAGSHRAQCLLPAMGPCAVFGCVQSLDLYISVCALSEKTDIYTCILVHYHIPSMFIHTHTTEASTHKETHVPTCKPT